MPYGISDDTWEAAKIELRGLLIAKARGRSVVPYSELASQLQAIHFEPDDFAFHRMLDEVSSEEDDEGRGLLTVVVVHKAGDMRPGPGFFELAKSRGRAVDDIDTTWLAELDQVWGYWTSH
jgi:hypothetical protein